MLIFFNLSNFHDMDSGFDGLTWFDELTRNCFLLFFFFKFDELTQNLFFAFFLFN